MKNNNFNDLKKWILDNFLESKLYDLSKTEMLLLYPKVIENKVSEIHPDLFKLPNLKAIALKIDSNNINIKSKTLHTIYIDNNRFESIIIDCPNLNSLSMKNQHQITYNEKKTMVMSDLTIKNLILKTPKLNDLEVTNKIITSDPKTYKLIKKLKSNLKLSLRQKSVIADNIF